uniref:immunoglobulin domain-containing protein n=2 Tax=Marinifilum flexuosum TaxID=1117708 RepID=UPI002492FDE3
GTVLQTGSVLNLGNAELAESGTYTCKVYNDQNCNNVNIVYNVTVQENAKIKLHPVDKAICESDVPVSFDADGTAEGTVTYEWFDKGGNSVGTTKTLTIAANPENGQSYYCVVSGDVCNSATTNVANLTVYEEVVITDPSDQTSSDGESVSFSVSATGEPTIEYKWYEKTPGGVWTALAEGGIYSGVSTASLTIDPVSLSMN